MKESSNTLSEKVYIVTISKLGYGNHSIPISSSLTLCLAASVSFFYSNKKLNLHIKLLFCLFYKQSEKTYVFQFQNNLML